MIIWIYQERTERTVKKKKEELTGKLNVLEPFQFVGTGRPQGACITNICSPVWTD